MCAGTCRGQKRVIPGNRSYRHHEPFSVAIKFRSSEEQQALLSTKPSLQPQYIILTTTVKSPKVLLFRMCPCY